MRRPTASSSRFNLLKVAFAGAIVLAAGLSCSDSISPSADADGVIRIKVGSIEIVVPDSIKEALSARAGATYAVPISMSANVLSPTSSPSFAVASSCGGSGATPGYKLSRVAFAPEEIPNIAPYPITEDGWIPDSDAPLGFDFNFYGNTYSKVNVYSNGFLLFGPAPPKASSGYAPGGWIPSNANPKNIIAFGWTDWSPQLVQDGIRWQTRGTAPNRRFILQFNNVPEYYSKSKAGSIVPTAGRIMTQVVLSEGTNDITIYTSSMTVTNSGHVVTQGIQDLTGTQALADSFQNAILGITLPRIGNLFNLSNDAVRFSPMSTKDEVPPTITAPKDTTANNDPGLASAIVVVVPPEAKDGCSAVTVSGVRSDGVLSLDAPYPVGVTTITWTAKDADQNAATATQTVTVIDNEDPVWDPSAQSVIQVDATGPNGAVVTFNDLIVTDNVGVTSRSCEPASGSVFHVGTNPPVTCTASDAAGNSASTSFSVYVIGAHEQIGSLMEGIADLGLADGTLQPLLNQLRLAYTQTANGDAACKKVADFLSMVQKKSSNLSSDDMAALTAEATRIMNVMGCPAPVRASISTANFLGVQVQ